MLEGRGVAGGTTWRPVGRQLLQGCRLERMHLGGEWPWERWMQGCTLEMWFWGTADGLDDGLDVGAGGIKGQI